MSQIGWFDSASQQRILFEDAIDLAKQHGDWGGYPLEILTGMYQQITKERPDAVTATSLLQNARHVKLEKANDYFAEPDSNYATFRGSIVHNVLEANADGESVTEVRMQRELDGVPISGQPDSVRLRHTNGRTLLRDWKTTKELPKYNTPYSNHIQQVNIYRWILGLDPETTDLEVVYISMDGIKVLPLTHAGRTSRGRSIAEQHWNDERVEGFMRQRLALHQVTPILRFKDVPDDDLWQCRFSPIEHLCRRLAIREAAEDLSSI